MDKPSRESGFTLIELLVVIAIIGILSAVVLASLNDARQAAKESAIVQQVDSLAKLMELNSLATPGSSYTSADRGGIWIRSDGTSPTCDNIGLPGLTAGNVTKFREICNSMVKQTSYSGANWMLIRWTRGGTYGNHYTISVRPNPQDVACAGSSGGRYVGPIDPVGPLTTWWGPGCYYNP